MMSIRTLATKRLIGIQSLSLECVVGKLIEHPVEEVHDFKSTALKNRPIGNFQQSDSHFVII